MTALGSLVRVHSWALNEKRQKLAGLEELADKMHQDVEQLEANLNNEQRAAAGSMEGTIAFPAFVAAALERRKKLRESIADLGLAIDAARAEVREAFQEVKKYEFAQDDHERREREKVARREQRELDELGANIHRRKKASGGDGAA
jgi:flagellar export protein FliJ